MKWDKKILWQYIYYEFINPKKFLKSISFYRYLILFLLLYIVFFTKISLKIKIITTIFSFIIFFYLDIKEIERSGEHRFWHKKKTGIPTRSDIRAMKYAKKNNLKQKSAQGILDETEFKHKIIGAKVIKKEEDLKPILEKGIDAIPTEKQDTQKVNVPEGETLKGGLEKK